MNPKKPTNTLTWKKHDQHATIERTFREITLIDKTTEEVYKLTEVPELPPTTRKRKHK